MSRVLPLLLALTFACGKDEPPSAAAPPPAEKKPRTNVKTFEAPVPYGQQIPCAQLVKAADFVSYLGEGTEIGEVKDRSSSNKEATSVCAFLRGGTPVASTTQARQVKKNGILGVLPGDEYCTVTAMCSYPAELEDLKKTCRAQGLREDDSLGQWACVRETQRATEFAYTYKVIDPDTHCIFEVMGGPSVTNEALVQGCTRAALETIGPEDLVPGAPPAPPAPAPAATP
jgi:hypothetical protein